MTPEIEKRIREMDSLLMDEPQIAKQKYAPIDFS